MSEWWTYRLSDLILFSRDVYYRTFALYHHGIWPAHVVLILMVALAAVACHRARDDASRGRIVTGLLAICWSWIAIAFHAHRYATINWAATYFAGAFVLQAVLLLWVGLRGRVAVDGRSIQVILVGLGVLAVAGPLGGLMTGRQWDQVELLGLTPDPTAAATILVLGLSMPRVSRLTLVIPIVWCLVGGLTLNALHSPEAWWTWSSALASLAVAATAGGEGRFRLPGRGSAGSSPGVQ
ncbi:MAG TPA: DUF6064 family protein [Gemmatimonadales bacterium]|nr:DUF6064 family protein [Gemmatimonadales bacterium]